MPDNMVIFLRNWMLSCVNFPLRSARAIKFSLVICCDFLGLKHAKSIKYTLHEGFKLKKTLKRKRKTKRRGMNEVMLRSLQRIEILGRNMAKKLR